MLVSSGFMRSFKIWSITEVYTSHSSSSKYTVQLTEKKQNSKPVEIQSDDSRLGGGVGGQRKEEVRVESLF